MLGLPSFVVGSPAGLELYFLNRAQETLVEELEFNGDQASEEQFLSTLIGLARNG
jgi:hypothetical protein